MGWSKEDERQAQEQQKWIDDAVKEEREGCCHAIREACPMCTDGHPHDDKSGEVECEYCGRPIAAIQART